MKKLSIITFVALSFYSNLHAQNVGIGTSTPSEKLEVNGSVKITDGTQGAGKVLTSDSSGKATWETPATGISLPYSGVNSSGGISFKIVNDNAGTAIYGYNMGGGGTGLYGYTSGGSNSNGAVGGTGPGGRGIYGYSTSNGTGGYFTSVSGLALKTGTGNVEMDGSLTLHSNLKIEGGNPGLGKVLTSDASGNATWSNAPVGFTVKKSSNQSIPTGGSTYTKVTFDNTGYQQGNAYSMANSEFVAPVSGYYRIETSITIEDDPVYGAGNGNVFVAILNNGYASFSHAFNRNSYTSYSSHPLSALMFLYAGEVITIGVFNLSSTPVRVHGNAASAYSFFCGSKAF